MIKRTLVLVAFLSLLWLSACSPPPQISEKTCAFKFTVLGYDFKRIMVFTKENTVYDKVSDAQEKATEISAFATFNLNIPTEVIFRIEEDEKYKLKIRDCEKLGIVLREKDKGVSLVHMDNYSFQ